MGPRLCIPVCLTQKINQYFQPEPNPERELTRARTRAAARANLWGSLVFGFNTYSANTGDIDRLTDCTGQKTCKFVLVSSTG